MWKLLLAAWIAYGPSGPIARTIVTEGTDCPVIRIDGTDTRMRVHSTPGPNYPVTVCETAIGPEVKSASIDGAALPIHKLRRSVKVALLGDTGCRLKAGKNGQKPQIQDCDDPKAWPFKQVADTIAAWDPDLILHVGDYYYREAKCKSDGTCQPAPYDWKRWKADFFDPAAKLLPNAPWVLVRGNHESCSRAAEGWFRFLETRPYVWENVKTCTSNLTFTPPYVADVGEMSVAVIDSSAAADGLDESQVTIFANELSHIAKSRPGTWMMLHHPLWGDSYNDEDSETMAAAWQKSPPAPVSLVLSGHIHALEILGFSDNRVPQFVVGNGGTALDPAVNDPTGQTLGGRTVASFLQENDFGFIAATREGNTWTFEIRAADGTVKATRVISLP